MRVLSISPYPFWDEEDRKGMPSIYLGHKAYVDAGHEVIYLYCGRSSRDYTYDGIQMKQFWLPLPALPAMRYRWLTRLMVKAHYSIFQVAGLIHGFRVCREFRPDVIYGQFGHAIPVAWILGRLFGVPNVSRMYGTFLYRYVHTLLGRLRKPEEVIAFKTPASYLIITNDGTMGAACAEALHVPRERVKFWRNGVDREIYLPGYDAGPLKDELGIPRSHKIILALSRLESWKRVDRLIRALPRVVARAPETTAVIVGGGNERAALERLADELAVRQHVRFAGEVLHADTPRYLNAADIFVSLYDVSNVGNPLLEALRCGRCIVSLDIGGTREVIPDDSVGILLKTEALDLLPDILSDLLLDDAKRARLQRATLARAEHVLRTWPERTRMEVELIERLVAGWHRPTRGEPEAAATAS